MCPTPCGAILPALPQALAGHFPPQPNFWPVVRKLIVSGLPGSAVRLLQHHSALRGAAGVEMEQVAFTISDIGIRDTCLEELSDFLLQSQLADKSRKALSLLNGLQDTKKRLSRLSQLGQRDVLHADPVAYGQLLTLLIEHSETQLQVIQKAISINPALGDIRPTSLSEPVTDREKRLVEMALQQR